MIYMVWVLNFDAFVVEVYMEISTIVGSTIILLRLIKLFCLIRVWYVSFGRLIMN